MSHFTRMNESCQTLKWVVSHVRVSHVTRMNASCHSYEWVLSHLWMSHVPQLNESCHTYEWVLSQIWMSHVTRMNESCQTYGGVMSHIWMSHGPSPKKIYFWAFVFGSRNGHIWALNQLSLRTHNSDRSLDNYFSISVQFFPPNGPSMFLSSRFTK